MAVPNIFGSATSAIPLSQLDTNFATPVTIGNTAVQLGNTVTSFGNVTLTNVTISSGNVTITGANVSGTANVSTLVVTGNQTFVGTGNRITGDFSNATVANRVAFQSSTTNANTVIPFIPNGTGNNAGFLLYNASDITNSARLDLRITATEASYTSTFLGTGIYLPMTFYTGGSERARIDTSGNVGIGTTSPAYPLTLGNNKRIGALNTGGAGVNFAILDGSNNVYLGDYSTNSSNTYLSGSSNVIFGTGNSNTERMRIDSSGNLLVGGTAQRNSAKQTIEYTSGNNGLAIYCVANASATDFVTFTANAGTVCGLISRVGTTAAVVYTATSDYRLKENITPMTGALNKIAQLKPVTYTWKNGGEAAEGFIAHELQEVCPDAVVGTKDEIDSDGNPKYQAVDQSKIVALLTAAMQEQQAIITALTARITSLESK